MEKTGIGRIKRCARAAVAILATTAAVASVSQAPALAASAVRGEAYGYYTDVSLFGGPSNRLGYGQPGGAPANSATPSIAIPTSGGTANQTDSDGAAAQYGPATIFGWWNTTTEVYENSGAQVVAGSGSISGSGTANVQAVVNNAGPGPLVMPKITTSCSASGSSRTGVVRVQDVGGVNAVVETSHDPETGEVTSTEDIPEYPSPGTEISGSLDHIGDTFTIVFNEQVTNGDGSKTVIGAHMYLEGPIAVGDMVIAVATCGVTA
jgi:hypothetical protein